MPAFVDSLKTFLEGQGHTSIFVGNTPDQPRDVIVLIDSGGLPPSLDDNAPGAPELYSIQIKARRARQEDARAALVAIQSDLHRVTGTNLGSFNVLTSDALDRPAIFTRDEKESWTLVQNYEIWARENI